MNMYVTVSYEHNVCTVYMYVKYSHFSVYLNMCRAMRVLAASPATLSQISSGLTPWIAYYIMLFIIIIIIIIISIIVNIIIVSSSSSSSSSSGSIRASICLKVPEAERLEPSACASMPSFCWKSLRGGQGTAD